MTDPIALVALSALELLVLGLAAWQLVVLRRSIRADRETAVNEPPQKRP